MKVEGPKGPNAPQRTGTARKSGDAGAFSKLLESGDSAEATATAPTSGIAPVGGLFMLQSENDAERKRRARAMQDAQDSLGLLDDLMRAMLDNTVSLQTLERLQARAVRGGDEVADPQLASLLAQVDIRLAVEAAKLEKAAESNT